MKFRQINCIFRCHGIELVYTLIPQTPTHIYVRSFTQFTFLHHCLCCENCDIPFDDSFSYSCVSWSLCSTVRLFCSCLLLYFSFRCLLFLHFLLSFSVAVEIFLNWHIIFECCMRWADGCICVCVCIFCMFTVLWLYLPEHSIIFAFLFCSVLYFLVGWSVYDTSNEPAHLYFLFISLFVGELLCDSMKRRQYYAIWAYVVQYTFCCCYFPVKKIYSVFSIHFFVCLSLTRTEILGQNE